ncbi:exopolygalacturonase [Medicago truncatula]|uniref:exopolygalacturonase n=1 Tax=Medicago truncatula TaxID=3880 RepID=UPI000D2F1EB6|nr:exopolygalacturonase [Medicago truncatula]
MTLTKLQIKAPGDSPNTDGIKIGKSTGINITSVNIRTGNDCISMLSGLKNVQIMDVYCGPGHGINIGSLGKYEDEEDLADIIVKNCTFNGTSNGVRIKSYESQLNKTVVASNFIYEDIVMENVEYHINASDVDLRQRYTICSENYDDVLFALTKDKDSVTAGNFNDMKFHMSGLGLIAEQCRSTAPGSFDLRKNYEYLEVVGITLEILADYLAGKYIVI